MLIKDDFKIKDTVSGWEIKVVIGKHLNWIHMEKIGEPVVNNRDFYFTPEGEFDGTGSDAS